MQLKLLDNIQFIYELSLAELELNSFSDKSEVSDDFRTFSLPSDKYQNGMKKRLAYFKNVNGEDSDYFHLQKYNQTKSPNQYLTHWIYPYKGKFHPQMIRALMNVIKLKKGDVLLDPFVGSGTSVLEAQILGIDSIGIDVSPLCVLISKVKTQSVGAVEEIERYQDGYLMAQKGRPSTNEKVVNFYEVARMMAHSDQTRRGKNFETAYVNDAIKMLKSVQDYKKAIDDHKLEIGTAKIAKGDARHIGCDDESIDGIITSPPYSIALNYVANDAHALKAMGFDTDKIKDHFIGVRGAGFDKFALYDGDMEKAYSEMFRVLKKGKYCVIIVGNVTYQGQEIHTTDKAVKYCEQIGFKLVKKIDKIIYGLYNIMQKEYILIFQKPEGK